MQRRTAFALALVLGSSTGCTFAVKHPAVTAGLVAGTMALGTCELATENHKACFTAAPIAGVGLATVAAIALWLGSEDATTTHMEPQQPDYADPNAPTAEPRPTLPTPFIPPASTTPPPSPPPPASTTPPPPAPPTPEPTPPAPPASPPPASPTPPPTTP